MPIVPSVSNVSPRDVKANTPTDITITGSNLGDVTKVYLGSLLKMPSSTASAGRVTVSTGNLPAGSYAVSVMDKWGQKGSGGNITVTAATQATTVAANAAAATKTPATTTPATQPISAGVPGVVVVSVGAPMGPPQIMSVSPSAITESVAANVTITGRFLSKTYTVTINNIAQLFSIESDTQITLRNLTMKTTGQYVVTVKNGTGATASTVIRVNPSTTVNPLKISSVSPPSVEAGSTFDAIISGSGFNGVTRVILEHITSSGILPAAITATFYVQGDSQIRVPSISSPPSSDKTMWKFTLIRGSETQTWLVEVRPNINVPQPPTSITVDPSTITGGVGTWVTVSGKNFGNDIRATLYAGQIIGLSVSNVTSPSILSSIWSFRTLIPADAVPSNQGVVSMYLENSAGRSNTVQIIVKQPSTSAQSVANPVVINQVTPDTIVAGSDVQIAVSGANFGQTGNVMISTDTSTNHVLGTTRQLQGKVGITGSESWVYYATIPGTLTSSATSIIVWVNGSTNRKTITVTPKPVVPVAPPPAVDKIQNISVSPNYISTKESTTLTLDISTSSGSIASGSDSPYSVVLWVGSGSTSCYPTISGTNRMVITVLPSQAEMLWGYIPSKDYDASFKGCTNVVYIGITDRSTGKTKASETKLGIKKDTGLDKTVEDTMAAAKDKASGFNFKDAKIVSGVPVPRSGGTVGIEVPLSATTKGKSRILADGVTRRTGFDMIGSDKTQYATIYVPIPAASKGDTSKKVTITAESDE